MRYERSDLGTRRQQRAPSPNSGENLPIVNDFGDSARSQSPEFAARAARIFREAPEG
jgi:hypothetical protein